MTELNTESQLLLKLLEERLIKTMLTYQGMVGVSWTDGDKRFYQGKAEGLQTANDILTAIKGEIK